ncbi:MAG: hypothetical protein QXK86_05940 [Candidatus Bathyarchaeia archaeon]
MKVSKKLVYVSEDVLNAIAEVCRREGIAVGKFIDDALREAVRLEGLGYGLKEAVEFMEVVRAQRVLGGVFMPREVLDFMVESVYRAERDKLLAQCFEAGKLYGRYLRERFRDHIGALKSFLEFTRWDLGEVNVSQEGGAYRLRCVSTVLSAEGTELLAKFLEGAVSGFGCNVLKLDSMRGIIVIEFREKA